MGRVMPVLRNAEKLGGKGILVARARIVTALNDIAAWATKSTANEAAPMTALAAQIRSMTPEAFAKALGSDPALRERLGFDEKSGPLIEQLGSTPEGKQVLGQLQTETARVVDDAATLARNQVNDYTNSVEGVIAKLETATTEAEAQKIIDDAIAELNETETARDFKQRGDDYVNERSDEATAKARADADNAEQEEAARRAQQSGTPPLTSDAPSQNFKPDEPPTPRELKKPTKSERSTPSAKPVVPDSSFPAGEFPEDDLGWQKWPPPEPAGTKPDWNEPGGARYRYDRYRYQKWLDNNKPSKPPKDLLSPKDYFDRYIAPKARGQSPGELGGPKHRALVEKVREENDIGTQTMGKRRPDAVGRKDQILKVGGRDFEPLKGERVLYEADNFFEHGSQLVSEARMQVRQFRADNPNATIVVQDVENPSNIVVYEKGEQPPPPGRLPHDTPNKVRFP